MTINPPPPTPAAPQALGPPCYLCGDMRISLAWLADFIDLSGYTPQQIADALTGAGLEVEALEEAAAVPGGLQGVVVGHVLDVWPHPGADRLRLTRVDVGQAEPVQIVCGAANVAANQKVPVALPGAVLHPTGAEEPLKIKAGKIRGEVSAGMICAEDELGIGTGHEGILVLDAAASVGQPVAAALGLESDQILEIGLTPNRGDAASHLGVARDLAALLERNLCLPEAALPAGLAPSALAVSIADPADAPHYHTIVLEGVSVGPSPAWLQKRLGAIGVASLNNVVDVTNYLCHHLGQPMHAFDAEKLQGGLQVRRAGQATALTLLDKRSIALHPDDLVIADARGPVALAGAIGGLDSAVSEQTTRIVLEVACFNPVAVRKTAARHAVKTDASFRFERGVDPSVGPKALALAVALLQDVAGAQVQTAPAVAQGQPLPERHIEINHDRLQRLIGQAMDATYVQGVLHRLGFGLYPTLEGYEVEVPPHRLYDVEGLADVAEEVIRLYGLNNLALPASIQVRTFDAAPGWASLDAQADIGALLAADGFVEIVTNSLGPAGGDAAAVRLLNPLSEELSQMRTSPLPALLEALAYNANRRAKALKLFEFGRTYHKAPEGGYGERAYLSLAVWGQPEATWQEAKPAPLGLPELSAAVARILGRLGAKPSQTTPVALPAGLAEASALMVGKRELGYLGLASPAAHKAADLKGQAYVAIFWWDELLRARGKAVFKAAEPPKFPEVRRDLSLVVDEAVTFAQLRQAAQEAERKLLRDVQLFDIFTGPGLGVGKKAYALAFTLADPEATLTDTQIDSAMQRLEKRFADALGAVVRR